MSELCNNSACFSVEIKGTSDICVTFVVYACGKSILGVRTHEKDTADRRQRHLYMVPANTYSTGLPGENGLYTERSAGRHQEEMPLVVCCNLTCRTVPAWTFWNEACYNNKLPFILASCHDKDDYEQEAMRRGATLCMDKMKGLLLQDKLVEYAYRQLSGGAALNFHKLLFVYAEDTSAEVLRAAMLQKGFDLIWFPRFGKPSAGFLRIRKEQLTPSSGTAGRHSNGAVSYATAGGGDVPNEESPCPASAVFLPH